MTQMPPLPPNTHSELLDEMRAVRTLTETLVTRLPQPVAPQQESILQRWRWLIGLCATGIMTIGIISGIISGVIWGSRTVDGTLLAHLVTLTFCVLLVLANIFAIGWVILTLLEKAYRGKYEVAQS